MTTDESPGIPPAAPLAAPATSAPVDLQTGLDFLYRLHTFAVAHPAVLTALVRMAGAMHRRSFPAMLAAARDLCHAAWAAEHGSEVGADP